MDVGKTENTAHIMKKLLAELRVKIDNFQEHCSKQTIRVDVFSADLKVCVEWRDKHVQNAEQFHSIAETRLCKEEPTLNLEDSASHAGSSSSRGSMLSKFKIDAIETEIRNKIEVKKLALEKRVLEAKRQYER